MGVDALEIGSILFFFKPVAIVGTGYGDTPLSVLGSPAGYDSSLGANDCQVQVLV